MSDRKHLAVRIQGGVGSEDGRFRGFVRITIYDAEHLAVDISKEQVDEMLARGDLRVWLIDHLETKRTYATKDMAMQHMRVMASSRMRGIQAVLDRIDNSTYRIHNWGEEPIP